MAGAIIKTLPHRFVSGQLTRFLSTFSTYYFTLGRGRPKRYQPWQLFFTHKGSIIGDFTITRIVRNAGDLRDGAGEAESVHLPKLTTLDGEESAWQIPAGNWVAVCAVPFHPLEEKLYFEGFRGWRYFDLDSYRGTLESKIRI